jgi:hypothetical protein
MLIHVVTAETNSSDGECKEEVRSLLSTVCMRMHSLLVPVLTYAHRIC